MNLELQKGSRSKILAAIVLGIMAVFVVRLFYLQIIQHGYYVKLANNEQVKRLTIPAKRGFVYALDNQTPVPLVMNQTVYTVFADPQMTTNNEKIVDVIRRIAGGNARSDLKTLLEKSESRYQVLATKVTRTQADKIKKEKLKGVGFQQESQRVYPEGSLASQVLGFVDFDGVGRYGVEGKLNDRLSGVDGMLQSVTDVSNVPLTIGNDNIDKKAVDGDNIVLSIDRNIQSHVEKALVDGAARTSADLASAIVMDPQTGKILAMANLPDYKPAEYNKVENIKVFNNSVVSDPYEPGSVIKAFTLATGIDKGVVNANSTYVNTDHIKVGDRTISNGVFGHTGTITIQQALNWSLNTGFVTVAERLGDGSNITRQARDTMYDYFYNKFKLGQLTGVEIDNESPGTIISPTKVNGNAVQYATMSFGQGLDLTMVQVASAFCSLVNGGNYYKPSVIAGVLDNKGVLIPEKIKVPVNTVAESTAIQVRQMLHTVRTSLSSNIDKPGYYLGGKTGTAQLSINGTVSNSATVATYIGYGGSEELSKYVIMIRVSSADYALRGAQEAGPIFTDISNWIIDYLKLQPKG